MTSERQIQEQVKQLLIKAGWNSDDILEEQSVHSQGKVMRADWNVSSILRQLW